MNENFSSPKSFENIPPFDQEMSIADTIITLGEALDKSDQEIYELFKGLKATENVSYALDGAIVIRFSLLEDVKTTPGGDPVEFAFKFEAINKNASLNQWERVFDNTFVGTGALQSATYLRLKDGSSQVFSKTF